MYGRDGSYSASDYRKHRCVVGYLLAIARGLALLKYIACVFFFDYFTELTVAAPPCSVVGLPSRAIRLS